MKNVFFLTLKQVLWKDRLSLFLIITAFVVNILCSLTLWWQIRPDETGVVLHYNVFFGIDVISFDLENFYFQIFLGSIGALVVWFLNFILGFILYFQVIADKERETSEYFREKKAKAEKREFYLDFLDAKILSSYLLWAGSLIVQLALAVYVLSIVMVNK